MLNFITIIKNELRRYFASPLAYVYLLTFLFLNASFTLYLGHWLDRGVASLDIMFAFLPWIYLIFISGIAMRLWAEEFKSKTVIQLLTLPVSTTSVVWGKFVAAWLFCGIGLLLTFPFVLAANFLGTPDNHLILAGYGGAFLLGGAMLAVTQMMSALTKNQVIALVLGVIANLIFLLSGVEYVLGFFRSFLPFEMIETIAKLSFLSHFSAICRGVISPQNILFFICVIIVFNFFTNIIIRIKTSGKFYSKTTLVLSAIFVWLGFIGIVMLAETHCKALRWDVTQDKHFTLSPAAKKILSNISEPVTVKIYYSKILSERNPLFREGSEYLRQLMLTYRQIAGDKFSYRFYYPEPLNEAEDKAIHDHIAPIPLPDLNQNAYFGLSLIDESGKSKSIPLIPLENLEEVGQDILQNIYELSNKKPTVGILSSLPLFGFTMDNSNSVGARWQLIDEIERLYTIKSVKSADDLKGIDVLFMIHPQNLSQELTDAIKRYTLNHGKILVLADLAAEAQRLYSPLNKRLTPSDLNGLDEFWGFHFNPNAVVADLKNSITVNTGNKSHASFAQDVIQFSLSEEEINRTQPETKNLSSLLFASAAEITPLKDHPSTFIPLLQTSSESALILSNVVYDNVNPADILAQFKSDGRRKTIAAKVIGNASSNPFEVIVIGDSDFAYDDFWSQFKMLEEHKYLVLLNDNATLILNALDALSHKSALIDVRQGLRTKPRFEAWETLRKQNARETAVKEREIIARINEVKIRLNDLWQTKNFENRQDFSDDELSIISDFRKSLQALKKELSDLKRDQNANLTSKRAWIVFFTLYLVPLGLFLILVLSAFLRRSPQKYSCDERFSFSRKSLLTAGICLLLFTGGVWSIFTGTDAGNNFENRPVFPDWAEQLNNIQTIRLEKNKNVLDFYKKDGLWQIKGAESYALYQRRIINFLATLANARYLERKSARAEYLPQFGLDASHLTTLTLGDDIGNSVLQFDIGKYDEEIGRGGRGAFLKFPNKFQVWLIDADFISLSTDWRDWTMNTALNQRFGRILSTKPKASLKPLISLLRELFITPLTLVEEDPKGLRSVWGIRLTFENQDNLTIYFEQSGDKYYIRYVFGQTQGAYLNLFASYAKNKRYEIPSENMEKIKNVIPSFR